MKKNSAQSLKTQNHVAKIISRETSWMVGWSTCDESRDECYQKAAKKIIQDLCSQVADNLPVVVPWDGGLNEKLPWGCILTKEGDGVCDGCPVQDVCPHPHKSWSK